jgi:hypothetical protein
MVGVAGVALCVAGVVAGAGPTGAGTNTITNPNLYLSSQADADAPSVNVLADSCPTVGACVAVGEYFVGNQVANAQPAVAVLSANTWSVSYLPATSPAQLNAVSCPSVGSCEVVGEANAIPIAFALTNGTFTLNSPPLPSGFTAGTLTGVSCPSVGSCVAVGYVSSQGIGFAFIDTLANGTWTPSPPILGHSGLDSVSCTGAVTACVAVGQVAATGGQTYLVATDSGAAPWSYQSLNSPQQPSTGTLLASVSCAVAGSCVAVGGYGGSSTSDSAEVGGIEVLSNGTWSSATAASGSSPAQFLTGVSCPTSASCVATAKGEDATPMVERLNNGAWSAQEAPLVGGTYLDALAGVSCASASWCEAGGGSLEVASAGSASGNVAAPYFTTAEVPTQGYWLLGYDGGVFSFGTANFHGSTGGIVLNEPVVGIASTPDGGGYWTTSLDGGVFAFGDAQFYGSLGGYHLNAPIEGIASTPDGKGYWLVASDGGVFSFGDAQFYGSTGGIHLNKPIVGIAVDPATGGYWLVAEDGGIFAFNAPFFGSTGGMALNKPILGMAATDNGGGYWLVASDGGVFCFGDAPFFGSTGGMALNAPIVSIAPTNDGGGYFLTGDDGGIFNFGDSAFYGSAAGAKINGFIVRGVTQK